MCRWSSGIDASNLNGRFHIVFEVVEVAFDLLFEVFSFIAMMVILLFTARL